MTPLLKATALYIQYIGQGDEVLYSLVSFHTARAKAQTQILTSSSLRQT